MQLNYTILEILLKLFLAAPGLRKEIHATAQRRTDKSSFAPLRKAALRIAECLHKLFQQFYSFFNWRVSIKQTVEKTFFMILRVFDKKLGHVFAMDCFNERIVIDFF